MKLKTSRFVFCLKHQAVLYIFINHYVEILIQVYSVYMITPHIPKLLLKKFYFFFTKYKSEWKERKFCRRKNQKSDFYKNKKVTKIDDIDANKILVSKEKP